jgi:hypothetical protein
MNSPGADKRQGRSTAFPAPVEIGPLLTVFVFAYNLYLLLTAM